MKHWALEYLACPRSGEKLVLEDAQSAGEEIISGTLVSGSGHSYPIYQGVPCLGLEAVSPSESQTVAAFGKQWDTFACQDGFMGSVELFQSMLSALDPDAFRGKVVLEAGCGNGRWLKAMSGLTNDRVIGLDYSSSAYHSWRNTRHLPNVTVVRGSILQPPLAQGAFDLITSVGVIHHLDSPARGMNELRKLLAPGGKIAIWVYAHEGNELYLKLVRPLRKISPSLPRGMLLPISQLLALPVWLHAHTLNHWCGLRSDGSSRLPMAGYFELLRRLKFRDIVNVAYDQLTPELAHYYRRDEIDTLFAQAGLALTNCTTPRGNSYSLVGTQAVAAAARAA